MSMMPEDLGPIDRGEAERAIALFRFIRENLKSGDVHRSEEYSQVASTLAHAVITRR